MSDSKGLMEQRLSREDLLKLAAVAGGAGLLAGRVSAAGAALERPRREHELPTERSERQRGPTLAAEHPRSARRPVRLEEVRDIDAKRRGDPLERGDARVRTAPLDLAQEALRETRPGCDRLQRDAAKLANRPQPLPYVDVRRFRLSDQRLELDVRYLHAHRRKLKRH